MRIRAPTVWAGVACVASSLCLFGAAWLAFVFPYSLNEWKDRGEALPNALQFVADLSHFVKVYGLLVFPAFIAAIVLAARWFSRTLRPQEDSSRGPQ